MAISAAREGNTLERYTSEVRSLWGDGKDPQLPYRVKGLLEKLLASTSPDEPWMAQLIKEAKPARELYRRSGKFLLAALCLEGKRSAH